MGHNNIYKINYLFDVGVIYMATYEKRRNTEGQITAIRVKVRGVGLPHLSQTFPVFAKSQLALKAAEKAAKTWADEVTANFGIRHGNSKLTDDHKSNFSSLGKAWSNASSNASKEDVSIESLPFPRLLSSYEGDRLIKQADTSKARILMALLLDCGLSIDEAANLRWQHIHLHQKYMDVLSMSGLVMREVPLTHLDIEVLLTSKVRKYGLVFAGNNEEMANLLPIELVNTFGLPTDDAFIQNIRTETVHRMADRGFSNEKICNYLGINSIEELNVKQTQHQVVKTF